MSVYVTLRAAGDPDALERYAADNREAFMAIAERARGKGAIHHRFFASADGGTIAVFDEWESEEGFRTFFSSSPEIPQTMQAAGVTSERARAKAGVTAPASHPAGG